MFNASIYPLTARPPETGLPATETPPSGDDPPAVQHGALAHLPRQVEEKTRTDADFAGHDLVSAPYDVAGFRTQLSDWLDLYGPVPVADDVAEASADLSAAYRLSKDLHAALIAAAAMSAAHGAQALMTALSRHPLVRLSAVSHPFVLGTFLEAALKKMFEIPDLDPEVRTGPRYQEKIVAALVNWNYVQPAMDAMTKSALGQALKVIASAVISGMRELAERDVTRHIMATLPPDASPGPRKLTDMETLFVNTLMCMLRNAGIDIARQVIKAHGIEMLPKTTDMMELARRQIFMGRQVAGALPAAAVAVQEELAKVLRDPPTDPELPGSMAYELNNPF